MTKLKYITEMSDFFNTTENDFLTTAHKKREMEFRGKIKKGMFINLGNEYGDVWHEVEKIHEPEDFYGTVYAYDRVSSKSEETKVEMYRYYNIRKISETLPDNARIIYRKSGVERT